MSVVQIDTPGRIARHFPDSSHFPQAAAARACMRRQALAQCTIAGPQRRMATAWAIMRLIHPPLREAVEGAYGPHWATDSGQRIDLTVRELT
jgi:hypothetical protein